LDSLDRNAIVDNVIVRLDSLVFKMWAWRNFF